MTLYSTLYICMLQKRDQGKDTRSSLINYKLPDNGFRKATYVLNLKKSHLREATYVLRMAYSYTIKATYVLHLTKSIFSVHNIVKSQII